MAEQIEKYFLGDLIGSVFGEPDTAVSSAMPQTRQWVERPNRQLFNLVGDELKTRFTPAPTTPYSGFTPGEVDIQGQLAQLPGVYQPFLDRGLEAVSAIQDWGISGPSEALTSTYRNMFTPQVIDALNNYRLLDLNRNIGDIRRRGRLSDPLGGYGVGEELGIQSAVRESDAQQRLMEAQLLKENFYESLDRASKGLAMAADPSNIGNIMNVALTGLGAYKMSEAEKRQLEDQNRQWQLQEFFRELDYPRQLGSWASGILQPNTANWMGQQGEATTEDGTGWLPQLIGGISGIGSIFSDERLKENKNRVGQMDDGTPIYTFNYKGNPQTQMGVMAQDVEQNNPNAVGKSNGYKTVNYSQLNEGGLAGVEGYLGGGWIPVRPPNINQGYVSPRPLTLPSPPPTDNSGNSLIGFFEGLKDDKEKEQDPLSTYVLGEVAKDPNDPYATYELGKLVGKEEDAEEWSLVDILRNIMEKFGYPDQTPYSLPPLGNNPEGYRPAAPVAPRPISTPQAPQESGGGLVDTITGTLGNLGNILRGNFDFNEGGLAGVEGYYLGGMPPSDPLSYDDWLSYYPDTQFSGPTHYGGNTGVSSMDIVNISPETAYDRYLEGGMYDPSLQSVPTGEAFSPLDYGRFGRGINRRNFDEWVNTVQWAGEEGVPGQTIETVPFMSRPSDLREFRQNMRPIRQAYRDWRRRNLSPEQQARLEQRLSDPNNPKYNYRPRPPVVDPGYYRPSPRPEGPQPRPYDPSRYEDLLRRRAGSLPLPEDYNPFGEGFFRPTKQLINEGGLASVNLVLGDMVPSAQVSGGQGIGQLTGGEGDDVLDEDLLRYFNYLERMAELEGQGFFPENAIPGGKQTDVPFAPLDMQLDPIARFFQSEGQKIGGMKDALFNPIDTLKSKLPDMPKPLINQVMDRAALNKLAQDLGADPNEFMSPDKVKLAERLGMLRKGEPQGTVTSSETIVDETEAVKAENNLTENEEKEFPLFGQDPLVLFNKEDLTGKGLSPTEVLDYVTGKKEWKGSKGKVSKKEGDKIEELGEDLKEALNPMALRINEKLKNGEELTRTEKLVYNGAKWMADRYDKYQEDPTNAMLDAAAGTYLLWGLPIKGAAGLTAKLLKKTMPLALKVGAFYQVTGRDFGEDVEGLKNLYQEGKEEVDKAKQQAAPRSEEAFNQMMQRNFNVDTTTAGDATFRDNMAREGQFWDQYNLAKQMQQPAQQQQAQAPQLGNLEQQVLQKLLQRMDKDLGDYVGGEDWSKRYQDAKNRKMSVLEKMAAVADHFADNRGGYGLAKFGQGMQNRQKQMINEAMANLQRDIGIAQSLRTSDLNTVQPAYLTHLMGKSMRGEPLENLVKGTEAFKNIYGGSGSSSTSPFVKDFSKASFIPETDAQQYIGAKNPFTGGTIKDINEARQVIREINKQTLNNPYGGGLAQQAAQTYGQANLPYTKITIKD